MIKEFVPYEQALALKKLGFDAPCFAQYTVIPEDDINWFTIPEQGITDKTSFGSSKNYNSKSFEEEGTISAPTYSQAFRWFREKYDLQCWSEPTGSDRYSCRYDGNDETGRRWVGYLRNNNKEILFHPTYEEAELACLKKLIEIVNSHKLPDLTWKDASEEEIKSKELKSMKGKSL